MSMNFPIDLRKLIFSTVVPVMCGTCRGTAFFVSPDTLITARHVLVDYIIDGNPIIVKVGDKEVLCRMEAIGQDGEDVDVVLLKCIDYTQKKYLKLLSAKFNESAKLTITGYPSEFGNCSELISIEAHDRLNTHQHDYDTMVVRTDSLAFTSYKGFSGAPVLNEKGSVIGVATNQYDCSLGYISIKSITSKIEYQGVQVNKDWQNEDFTALGRGNCHQQVEKAIGYASLRYKEELHINNDDLDKAIDLFALRALYDNCVEKLKPIEDFVINYQRCFGNAFDNYVKGNYLELKDRLWSWQINEQDERGKNKAEEKKDKGKQAEEKEIVDFKSQIEQFFKEKYSQLSQLEDEYKKTTNKIMVLRGMAGMGKTHYVCATAKRLVSQMNVYLVFGSQFSEIEDFESQLCKLLQIGGHNLKDLNDKMSEENSNTLIIIDAINEGATEYFWNSSMLNFKKQLEKFDRIKIILTFREDEGKNYNFDDEWTLNLEGFGDRTEEAVRKYFDFYQIKDSDDSIKSHYKREFNEPLFLSIFCEVAQNNYGYVFQTISYSNLFKLYIQSRNESVSNGVDEDPHRNVTQRFLSKVAGYSLYYNDCEDISRAKARQYSNQIVRNRSWSSSLLYWILKENLMLSTGRNGETLMFGYQKLGDFLMADVFAHNKMSDEAKVEYVLELGRNLQSFYKRRFLTALLSDWELMSKLLEKKKAIEMTDIILDSLHYGGQNVMLVTDWMMAKQNINIDILHDHFLYLPLKVFEKTHEMLMKLEMSQRDKTWTLGVNKKYAHSYDSYLLEKFINLSATSESDYKKYVLLLCWMCTTPHPEIRARVLRKLVAILEDQPNLAEYIIEKFHDCNDPYVVQVCFCAIYGHLLRNRNKKECNSIASLILSYFYSDEQVSMDILVRQWTMLCLMLADELNGDNVYVLQSKQTFKSENPYHFIVDKDMENDDAYFGTSDGSKRMHYTLFSIHSDFNRYVLGSNSSSFSSVFYLLVNGDLKPLSLNDLALMIANVAKHSFGWNDELGVLDKGVYSAGRYDNKIERFGKKYLWIALYKVEAALCDYFKVVDDRKIAFRPKIDEVEPIPYPWHTPQYSRIDPTLLVEKMPYTTMNFEVNNLENVDKISSTEWMSENFPIPAPRLMLHDSDGHKWVVLTCYDGHNEPEDNETKIIKDLFLYSNAAFIKTKELDTFKGWAKKQNFYGRWMPEYRNGSIDYLWNEYPWADTYKRTLSEMEDYQNSYHGKSFTLNLSYETQLQEDWTGIDDNEKCLRESIAPNHLVMSVLNLYTAERGIVRSKNDGHIVTTNFKIGRMNGMAIRQDYLDKYLLERHLSLVFYSLGEKYVRNCDDFVNIAQRFDLSGAFYYEDAEIRVIQPMHISNKL